MAEWLKPHGKAITLAGWVVFMALVALKTKGSNFPALDSAENCSSFQNVGSAGSLN